MSFEPSGELCRVVFRRILREERSCLRRILTGVGWRVDRFDGHCRRLQRKMSIPYPITLWARFNLLIVGRRIWRLGRHWDKANLGHQSGSGASEPKRV